MRTLSLALAMLVIAGCGHGAPTPPTPSPIEIAITPHREDFRISPVGTGQDRCEVYLYAWTGDGCRFQLNHCSLEREGSDSVVCLSLADERALACGATADACGQTVRCACPDGPAPEVAGDPETRSIGPSEVGARIASTDGRCVATTMQMPGGPPPAPCIFAVHECDPTAQCTDRQQMFSCGVRGTVCDRPVRCDCEQPISETARAAACAAPCADASARVRVYRTPAGAVARLAVEPSPSTCSHPPTTIFDGAGVIVGTLPMEPVAAGSPEQLAAQRMAAELLRGLESDETFSCSVP